MSTASTRPVSICEGPALFSSRYRLLTAAGLTVGYDLQLVLMPLPLEAPASQKRSRSLRKRMIVEGWTWSKDELQLPLSTRRPTVKQPSSFPAWALHCRKQWCRYCWTHEYTCMSMANFTKSCVQYILGIEQDTWISFLFSSTPQNNIIPHVNMSLIILLFPYRNLTTKRLSRCVGVSIAFILIVLFKI